MSGAMEQHALLQHDQDMVAEEQLQGSRSWRGPRPWLLIASLVAIAVAGKTAASFLHHGATVHGASDHDVVRLVAEAGAKPGADEKQIAKPESATDKAADEAAKKAAEAKAAEQAKLEEQSLKAADKLGEQATEFKKHSDDLFGNAKVLSHKTEDLRKDVADVLKDAQKDSSNAEKARQDAEDLRQKVEELKKQAASLDAKASGLDQDAASKETQAKKTDGDADKLEQQSLSLTNEATSERQRAVDTETKAQTDTATSRLCIQLPGVKLKGDGPEEFAPVVGNRTTGDDVECNDWCLKHADCKQSVFDWQTKSCDLFTEATAEPIGFKDTWPWFNSSYCGVTSEKDSILSMLKKVYDMKPWVPPAHNCSWGGENCIHTLCCADSCDANWDWSECKAFTCYKRDEFWAGCKTGGVGDMSWEGTRLGGHPNREIEPAPEGKLIQGTKLYCFTVVMWNQAPVEGWMNSEAELANHWKKEWKGIMQCDDYSMFDGLEGGSVHNIQSFIRAWSMVKDDGRYKNNDWSIKVDADAVFFPDHFRKKIEWIYKTPQGSAVYFRNTFYKFQFLGALEVLTREALEIYFDRGWECEAKLGQEGGEDYWLQQCLEGLGIDFQTDVGLLHDKYAEDENCADPNGVAHHFFKKIDAWDTCWNMANDAWNNEHGE